MQLPTKGRRGNMTSTPVLPWVNLIEDFAQSMFERFRFLISVERMPVYSNKATTALSRFDSGQSDAVMNSSSFALSLLVKASKTLPITLSLGKNGRILRMLSSPVITAYLRRNNPILYDVCGRLPLSDT